MGVSVCVLMVREDRGSLIYCDKGVWTDMLTLRSHRPDA